MSNLQTQIEAIIAESKATTFGVAVKQIESGEEVMIDADRFFPLCSVFKVPVLCEAFRQIRQGRFALDDRWTLTLSEKNLPSGVLVTLSDGLQPTVRDLLTLMIIISDNTATDMVMHRIGVGRTTQFMHELGLTDLHVPITIRNIFDDMLGEASDPRRAFTNLDNPPDDPPTRRDGRAYSLGADNNVATARAMTQLNAMIFQGQVVDRAACDQMLHIMLQQQLDQRLPRFLPHGTPIAHKTGTLGGIRNDSGIIYCSKRSHVAISAFATWDIAATGGDRRLEWERMVALDSAIGEIGRAVYDAYVDR